MASLSVGSQPHAAVEQSNQAVGKSFLDKHGKKILVAVAVLSIAAVAVAILANPPIAAALGLAAIIAKFSVLTSASTALVAIPVIKVGSIITGILGLSMLVGQTGITAGSALGAAGTAIINKLKKIRDNFGEVDGVPVMKRRLGVMGKDNAFAILKPKDPTCHSHKLNIDGRVMKCEITVNFEKDTWNRDKTITFINGKSVQSFQQEGCSADRFLEHMASQFPKAMPVENKRHLLENLTKAMMQSHALMGNELYGEYYGEQLGSNCCYSNPTKHVH
jgi:hypothetical protein